MWEDILKSDRPMADWAKKMIIDIMKDGEDRTTKTILDMLWKKGPKDLTFPTEKEVDNYIRRHASFITNRVKSGYFHRYLNK